MRVMPEPANPAHYWYGDDPAVADVLEAVRAFRRSDAAMRRRTAARMSMNETDMRALQVLIGREAEGLVTSPHHVTRELGISTASTTKLLDRLTDSGHLVRESHPTDRRAVVLRPSPTTCSCRRSSWSASRRGRPPRAEDDPRRTALSAWSEDRSRA